MQYLWVDAISVDQHDYARKKETILKMSDIYKMATYVLAVPDLHYTYLFKNTANRDVMKLISKHSDRIHQEILNIGQFPSIKGTANNSYHQSVVEEKDDGPRNELEELKKELKELKMKIEEDEVKKAYQFFSLPFR
ncbi:unnamed protein product [Cunninghamella blakesleeana]